MTTTNEEAGSGRPAEAPAGVLLVDKPPGPTSHDVVAWVRWAMKVRAVGHSGTLDPAASGLLVLCVGVATRLVRYLTDSDKTYRAKVVLGRATTTADADGETVSEAPVGPEVLDRALGTMAGLTGCLRLPPPAYSAAHIEGRRAHELARAGHEVDLAPRDMIVREVAELGREGRTVEATVGVSKGTYVRSLAEELGRRLGVPAHLGQLRRLSCGEFGLDDERVVRGLATEELERARDGARRWRIRPPAGVGALDRQGMGLWLRGHLLPAAAALPFPVVRAGDDEDGREAMRRLAHGQALEVVAPGVPGIRAAILGTERVAIRGPGGALVVVRVDRAGPGGGWLRPERSLALPAREA